MTTTTMMITKHLAALLLCLIALGTYGQVPKTIKGRVMGKDDASGQMSPLPGVNIYWLGTQNGASTDSDGKFKLSTEGATDTLVFSFVGFQTGYVVFKGQTYLEVSLKQGEVLEGAEIVETRNSTTMSMLNPLITQSLDRKELTKAACCNLSESFETNASVDAAYTDAVTGTRQIRMLGLDGKYVQITKDNIPAVRGLSTVLGLYYVPGPWVDQIVISKGVGSVTSGYESVTGQINVAIKDPVNAEKFHLNAYGNQGGRGELNIHTRQNVGRQWATTIMAHTEYNALETDHNNDGFMDNPLKKDVILRNAWKYFGDRGMEGEYQVTALATASEAGQTTFGNDNAALWTSTSDSKHIEASAKTGYVFPFKTWKSIGTQFSGEYHEQQSTFGDRFYSGIQRNLRVNLLYASIIGNTNHKFTTGVSYVHDGYDERLDSMSFARVEQVPGAYFEYTWNNVERFTLVAGMRVDDNNLYGLFWTPRLHFRYSFTENTSLKFAAGRAYRTANIIAENMGQMASSRQWVIFSNPAVAGFGLNPEVAWNGGVNLLHRFKLNYREATISVDFYSTRFENQVITDLEDARQVRFYNLSGTSISNSAQAEFSWSPIRRMDVRLAYRYLDVQADFMNERVTLPLISRHRAFANLAYETKPNEKKAQWKFDGTLNWIGESRLPSTDANPEELQLNDRSDAYFLVNAQITRVFSDKFEIYLGGENITNFRQPRAIVDPGNPFGNYFDASLVWGPVFGAMAYTGLRWSF
jgi:outer membrane receptor for ferrienterochelin and colicins